MQSSYAANTAGESANSIEASATPIPTAPTLTAAGSATVDANFNITFATDAAYKSAITDVQVGGASLVLSTDYTVGSGIITLKPAGNALLQSPGAKRSR